MSFSSQSIFGEVGQVVFIVDYSLFGDSENRENNYIHFFHDSGEPGWLNGFLNL